MPKTDKIKPDVSGTAFVVNYSRSKMVPISQDIYAGLWVTPDSISLWNELAQKVYPNDDLNISLRNRFYLEHIKTFIGENENPVFINIAAGFVSYPFLVEGHCRFIEIDLPNIIQFKKNKVAQWMKEKTLPARKIKFISLDLNNEKQRRAMQAALAETIAEKPSFVMMEGVTFYLTRKALTDIFKILRAVQPKGSLIAFDYWKPDTMTYPVMIKLKKYLDRKFGYGDKDWNLFDENYIRKIKNFTEIESADIGQLELKYSQTQIFQGRENKIPVYFSVLKKH